MRGAPTAGSPDPDRVTEQPGEGAELIPRLVLLLGDEEVRRAEQRPGDAAAHDRDHRPERQVDREYVQGAAPVGHTRAPVCGGRLPDLPGGHLAVVDHRVGYHPDLVARRARPPAEVDVITEQGQVRVEAAHLIPDVSAHQHAGRADRQHWPVAIVLALVELTGFDPGVTPTGPVGGDARLAQHAPVRQIPQLRAEHRRRPAAAGAPEHLLQRVGGGLAVIVQEPHPLHGRLRSGAGPP